MAININVGNIAIRAGGGHSGVHNEGRVIQ